MVSLGNLREHPLSLALGDFVADQVRRRRPSLILCVCAVTITCSLLLGGVARAGELSDAVLELLAVPALLLALSSLIDLPNWKIGLKSDAFWGLVLCGAIFIVPLIQLIPLPPGLWTMLPEREQIVKVFDVLGRQPPWMPISVSPSSTWLSFLSLLPPMAIFVAAIQLTYRERRGLILLIVAFAIISVFLGLAQLAQGPGSSLRFYTYTNRDDAVGFFANRDHFAALVYVAFVFASVWAVDVSFKFNSWTDLKSAHHFTIVAATAVLMTLFILLVGEAVARSRAGVGLTMVGLLAICALAFTERRRRSEGSSNKILFGIIGLALILSLQLALYRILERFTGDPLSDARAVFARNTIHAAWTFMPFGSGLGSFVPVYEMFEKPVDTLLDVYVNHAHNDYLELWLETGVAGIIVIGLFAYWLGSNGLKVWRGYSPSTNAFDRMLARAGTIVIALLLIHALVDFALQTEAIMAVFAVSCALLVEPCRTSDDEDFSADRRKIAPGKQAEAVRSGRAAGLLAQTRVVPPPPAQIGQPSSAPVGTRWGEDVEWPDEWRTDVGVGPSGENNGPNSSGTPD